MSFDAFMIKAVANELDRVLSGARVEKVLQPSKDEIFLVLHRESEHWRLQINAGPRAPRIGITKENPENPKVPPMFCMLMRKHLTGARINRIFQKDFERVIEIELETYDEMGFFTKRRLITEIMGRYSNAVLCTDEYKILSALRPVDFTTSSKRQLLAQMQYEMPPSQDKTDPVKETEQGFATAMGECVLDEKSLIKRYLGISPLLAREIVYRAEQKSDLNVFGVWGELKSFTEQAERGDFKPTIVKDAEGRPIEFSCFEVRQYGTAAITEELSDFGNLTDAFFAETERAERERQRAYATEKMLKNAEARLEKKLDVQLKELADTEKKAEYKQKADLITANIYRFSGRNEKITVIDYVDDGNGGYIEKEIELKIERGLTASEAAQKLYKKYNKAKNAEIEIKAQISKGEAELEYVRSVLDALSRCAGQSELDEIRLELTEAGYIKASVEQRKKAPQNGKKTQNTQKQLKNPIKLVTSGGFTVLIGKNNLQNDQLTFKTATKNDWWFHVKNVPGSHAVLLVDGNEPGDQDLTEAASFAAANSKAADQDKVLVDYTRIKNVKKPSGARPGYVIYEGYRTALVSPKK